jgi:hypothetical protein
VPSYYCFECGEQREFLNVQRTASLAQVTRATVYNWLRGSRLHVIVHPSGRKYICTSSVLNRTPGARHAEDEVSAPLAAVSGATQPVPLRPPLVAALGRSVRPPLQA